MPADTVDLSNVARLKQKPGDKVLIADLFRALHTVKGDASLCKVEMGC